MPLDGVGYCFQMHFAQIRRRDRPIPNVTFLGKAALLRLFLGVSQFRQMANVYLSRNAKMEGG